MEDLLAARLQMAVSLGLHIIFACIGMTMPWLMAVAEYRWLRTGDEDYLHLAKAWSKGVAVLFAVGAVSGTVLSLELGLLWPNFMLHAGPIIGMPFSWEGTAFFVEAIAIGLYLYGWQRLPRWVHWTSGVVVGIAGVVSGILVLSANAWMNSPAGFTMVNGEAVNVDPVAAMFNDAWASQATHMVLAAFASTGFAVAGVHAIRILLGYQRVFHYHGTRLAMYFGAVAALLQPLSGDFSAKDIAERQPAKLAAAEAHFHTTTQAPLLVGGIPDEEEEEVHFGIELPGMLSFLAHSDFDAEVIGLDQFPKEERPPVLVTHLAFQTMVGIGSLMALVSLIFLALRFKRPNALRSKRFLQLLAATTGLGFVATEAGWVVTEVGRQPYIIYGVMRTADAVTPMPGLLWPLIGTLLAYAALALCSLAVMMRLIHNSEWLPRGSLPIRPPSFDPETGVATSTPEVGHG